NGFIARFEFIDCVHLRHSAENNQRLRGGIWNCCPIVVQVPTDRNVVTSRPDIFVGIGRCICRRRNEKQVPLSFRDQRLFEPRSNEVGQNKQPQYPNERPPPQPLCL